MGGPLLLGATTSTGLLVATSHPRSAAAAAAAESALRNGPAVSAPTTTTTTTNNDTAKSLINTWLMQLENIPVFCIVDKTTGANYMLVKQDEGMAVGYAFTTFDGALTVLSEAQKTAKEKNYFPVWQDATITTIPMSIAIRLALKKRARTTPNEQQSLDSIVLMIPSADDRQDGISVDDRFKDQGRVPLFYVTTETNNNNNKEEEKDVLRLYFSRKDLLRSWIDRHPGERIPPVQALDLVAIFENTMRGRADLYLPTPLTLANLEFVPSTAAVAAAQELKSRGPLAPYSATKMIV